MIIIVLTLVALAVLLLFLYLLATGLGKKDKFFTRYPTQGFLKVITKGDVVTDMIISEPDTVYDLKSDTIVKASAIQLARKRFSFWYWLGGLYVIGIRFSVADFMLDRHVFALSDTGEYSSDVKIKEVTVLTKLMPLFIDATLEAHNVETHGFLMAFFKVSLRFSVVNPLKFYSLLKTNNVGVKKALGAVLAYIKLYAKDKDIKAIGKEDTTTGTSQFVEIILRVNLNTLLPNGGVNGDNLTVLTGLRLDSVELIDYGAEEDGKNAEAVDAVRDGEVVRLRGEASVAESNFKLTIAENNKKIKILENDAAEDLVRRTVVVAHEEGATEEYKYFMIANSNITTYAEGGARANLNLPAGTPPNNKGKVKEIGHPEQDTKKTLVQTSKEHSEQHAEETKNKNDHGTKDEHHGHDEKETPHH